jgi:hypothetical protein
VNTIADCRILRLPTKHMPQGNLTFLEGSDTVPFDIARVFYLYDVPVDSSRGGHAHRALEQLIVCVLGSFEMIVDDGTQRHVYTMRRADEALYVPPGIWGELVNFSSGAVCFTLASMPYEEPDYIRVYEDFVNYRRSGSST